jgi:integrase
LALQTVRNVLNLLRVCLQAAVDEGFLPSNPARDVRTPRGHGARTVETWTVLTPDEQQRLLAAVPLPDRWIVAFALGTGLRQGELWSLRWEDVTPEAIVVRYGTSQGPTKSGKIRRVPLFGLARDALIAWCAYVGDVSLYGPLGIVFPAKRGGRRDAKPPADWASWCAKASLTRRVRWHDLRHSCATSLVAGWWGRRWTLDEVCRLLGHSSVTVTERYAHAATDLLASAARDHDATARGAPSLAKARGNQTMKDLRFTNSRANSQEGEHLKLPLRTMPRRIQR